VKGWGVRRRSAQRQVCRLSDEMATALRRVADLGLSQRSGAMDCFGKKVAGSAGRPARFRSLTRPFATASRKLNGSSARATAGRAVTRFAGR